MQMGELPTGQYEIAVRKAVLSTVMRVLDPEGKGRASWQDARSSFDKAFSYVMGDAAAKNDEVVQARLAALDVAADSMRHYFIKGALSERIDFIITTAANLQDMIHPGLRELAAQAEAREQQRKAAPAPF